MKLAVISVVFAVASFKTANIVFPSTVLPLMDTTMDPCDDFYQSTCGSWIINTVFPDAEVNIDYTFSTITDRNNLVIQAIVKENLPFVGELWGSCMNMDVLTTLGSKPLRKTIVKIAASATKVAGEIAQIGELQSYEQAYRTYITKILNLAGYDPNAGVKKSDPVYAANAVIQIEKKFEGIVSNLGESDDLYSYYNSIKYSNAVAKYPLLFGAFAGGLGFLGNSKFTQSSNVVFHSLAYFAKVEKLVASLELKDLKTYLAFLYTSYNARKAFYGAQTYPFTLDRKGFFENIQKINQNNFAISDKKLGNPVG
uniref:Peptidase M13 N-terminal domain-containing protein n=1 Tax=Globisporangium ultimum (strain ATCC 200006 / CBS 805.95 / DAOM BR144) TaxID=431595 RepID=K3WP96_GLOUD